jgi:flagellin
MNADDRASIELEYSQLKAEITRIGQGTEYNSMKLIDGSRAKSIQMASNGTDAHANNTAIGANKVAADSVKVASFATSGTYAVVASASDDSKLELYLKADGASTYSKLDEFVKAEGNIVGGNEIHFDDAGIVFKLADNYTGNEFDATESSGTLTDVSTSGIKELVVDEGTFTTVQVGSNNDADQTAAEASVGADVTENRITYNIADATSAGLGISTIDLDSLGEAQSAINYLDAAIQKVNDERSNIGSLQNRFEFTSSNLLNSIQNNSASMSTIRDADFAVEAADLARNQILTQSGTAMLAQANQISQNVLSLLR